MERPIRVGVIGAGVMGAHHTRLFSDLPDCELVGVFDPDVDRAEDVTSRYGGTVYRQINDLLSDTEAVSVVSPTTTHAAVAHRALDFGRHMLVEKPMTASVAEAMVLADRARQSRCVVLVGHVERFNPVVQELRTLIAGQRVRRVTMKRVTPFSNRCLDTSVVSDLMIHDIDLVQSLFGTDIRTMAAHGAAVRTEYTDQALVEMTLTGGPSVSFIASRVGEFHTREIDITMDGTCLLADLLHRSISVTRASGSAGRTVIGHHHVPAAEPLRLELQHFLDCVRGIETPLIDADAGKRSIEWADRIETMISQRYAAQLATIEVGGLH